MGFYFNEDFAGGYVEDYFQRKTMASYFDANFVESFLNYDKFVDKIPHSPIFITLFLVLQKITFNEVNGFSGLMHILSGDDIFDKYHKI